MAYLIGNGTATKPMTAMFVGIGTGKLAPVEKIMAGTGSGATQIWPGKRIFHDDFGLENFYLSTSRWASIGTAPYNLMQSGGNGYLWGSTTDGTWTGLAAYREPTDTFDQYVNARIGVTGATTLLTSLHVHSAIDCSSYVSAEWRGNTITLRAQTPQGSITWGTATMTQAVGRQWELTAHENPDTGIFTYTVHANGIDVIHWDDTTHYIPKNATTKHLGWGSQFRRALYIDSRGPRISEWRGGDL
ncbi:hypothetical protein [Rhodococcus sp. BH5]|uniref:hypothetical protein n=1 Tax=Rhodococcus sp. BH5 TaxID=2871702 RepID=UPI0022CD702E|nr:hypothetical protein [Rhodococcus sp. BH5]MCZ9635171.1 hypothetical protein [Rhodococcus sp. BH5]